MIQARVVFAVALLLLAALIGAVSARLYYVPKLKAAEVSLIECNSKYQQLAIATNLQNIEIQKLEEQSKAREASVKIEVEKVKTQVEQSKKKAIKILSSRPPAGVEECKAASQAFAAELKQERAQ